MVGKPNYKFERLERDRAKAAKKAARRDAKKRPTENEAPEGAAVDQVDGESPESTDEPEKKDNLDW